MSLQARYAPYKKVQGKNEHEEGCPRFNYRAAMDALKGYWAAEREYFDDLRAFCLGEVPKQNPQIMYKLKAAVRKVEVIHNELATYCYYCQTFKTFIRFQHDCELMGFKDGVTKKVMNMEDLYWKTFLKDNKYKIYKADKEKEEKEKEKETKNADPDFRDEDLRQERLLEQQVPAEVHTALGMLRDSLPPIPSHITRSEESSCSSCSC